MPFAYITADNQIKMVTQKVSPFVRVEPGERLAQYNPPNLDPLIYDIAPVTPVIGDNVTFTVTPKPDVGEYIKVTKIALIQRHLDGKAKERGYDSILSAVSYAVDQNSPFYAEAVAYASWRSAVWFRGFEILAEIESGSRSVPSDVELISLLPELQIPA